MLAAAARMTVEAAPRLGIGPFHEFLWEGERGAALAGVVEDNFVLVVADKGANLGLLRLAVRRFAVQPPHPLPSA